MMKRVNVTIKNKAGLHARPSSMVVKTASQYKCDIFIGTENNMINAKSIMGMMTLGAGFDTVLILQAEGPDEDEAVKKIALLFENKFSE